MGVSDPWNVDPYKRQSIVLVPTDASGLTVVRPMSVMGYDDAPEGAFLLYVYIIWRQKTNSKALFDQVTARSCARLPSLSPRDASRPLTYFSAPRFQLRQRPSSCGQLDRRLGTRIRGAFQSARR